MKTAITNIFQCRQGNPNPSRLLSTCIIISFISVMGCTKFVQAPPPEDLLSTSSVFANTATATAAQLVIYSQMVNNLEAYNMDQNLGLLADELSNYSTYIGQIQFYTNAMSAVNGPGPWANAYNYIYQANVIIENLSTANSGFSPAIVAQLTGEAKFIRAFWYFYLTNLYGDVPLVLTSNYASNENLPRTPQSDIYSQVIADLTGAQGNLNTNYVDASDTTISGDRVRPNKWVATALLARVYLYTGKYDSAEMEATTVINNTSQYSLCQTLDSVFLTDNTEAIWQLQMPQPLYNEYNTYQGAYFILTSAPLTNTQNSTTISPQLLSTFEPGDLRATHWISNYISGTDTFYFPFKYKVYVNPNVIEQSTVLRLAEQFLIRAEAEAQESDLSDAQKDLNIIRSRAGLPPTTATTQSGLLAAILHERQVELFTEWGHRWFDLKRTSNLNSVMSIVTPMKGGNSWQSTDQLYPIPQTEINIDTKLVQNQGY